MQRKTDEWISRIKEVEREYKIARIALDRLIVDADHDSSITQDLRSRDIRKAVERLEGTYIIRLFAEFETGLRSYWLSTKKKKQKQTATHAKLLVDRIGGKHVKENDLISSVHVVRKYRNALIHEREIDAVPVPIPTARAHLCKFFAQLPHDWA